MSKYYHYLLLFNGYFVKIASAKNYVVHEKNDFVEISQNLALLKYLKI